MIVAIEIFPELYEVYLDCFVTSGKKRALGTIQKNRKKIKILVDTIYEQTIENLFDQKPRNYLSARKILNDNKHCVINDFDRSLLDDLSLVLRDYDVLIDKHYVDHTDKLSYLLSCSLKKLCLKLCSHSAFADDDHAKQLIRLLENI